jgi:PKD repeat protein
MDTEIGLWRFVVDYGDGTPTESFFVEVLDGYYATTTLTHTYADDGFYQVDVTATDDDGHATTASAHVQVANVAPAITALNAPSGATEGLTVVFSASANDPGDDRLTWTWDFGDGSPAVQGRSVQHAYDDNGVYTITLTVADEDGGSSSQTRTVRIANLPPQDVSAGADRTVDEGQTVTLTADFHELGTDDGPFGFLWQVTSSSGQAIADGTEPTFAFTPRDDGAYSVTLTVTDKDAASSQATMTVTARNVAPVLTTAGTQSTPEGALLTVVDLGTFSDPAFGPGETFEWTIDWGDGTAQDSGPVSIDAAGGPGTATQGSFDGTHTYADDGRYTVTVSLVDDDGGRVVRTFAVDVQNVAPVIDLPDTPWSISAGNVFRLGGTLIDPGADEWDVDVDYGNGRFVSALEMGRDFRLARWFATGGSFEITVRVRDDDGGLATDSMTLLVQSVWHNPALRYDVNGDGLVQPLDVLILSNHINLHPGDPSLPSAPATSPPFYDVNNDGLITASDVLQVVNRINALIGAAEGEAPVVSGPTAQAMSRAYLVPATAWTSSTPMLTPTPMPLPTFTATRPSPPRNRHRRGSRNKTTGWLVMASRDGTKTTDCWSCWPMISAAAGQYGTERSPPFSPHNASAILAETR